MKRFFCVFILFCILLTFCACGEEKTSGDGSDPADSETGEAVRSKVSVEEFMAVVERQQEAGELSDVFITKAYCYNVTPTRVLAETDVQIFKCSDSCASFALLNGKVYPICEFVGGYGFVDAVPCDFDGDGNSDLLISSSWGSGLHRSILSVWNTQTKESTVIHNTGNTDDPQIDLIATEDEAGVYGVYSVRISPKDNNLADLSYEVIDRVGTVASADGVAVYQSLPTS